MKKALMSKNCWRFFKALSNANRLKIVALLAQESLSVEEIAEILDLSSSTVSHHLAKLAKVGLVNARPESYYSVYYLELNALNEMAQRLLADDMLPTVAEDVDVDAYDRKVLETFMDKNGRITAFPVQQKRKKRRFCVMLSRYLKQGNGTARKT
ncbi:MAG: metalloregulator ArsR/SmtB family transcription factor [Chloroflexi bacterium]|nr:metalloregulator ArsR/SmtB family transcription factor [Chloroflexota bacterium]